MKNTCDCCRIYCDSGSDVKGGPVAAYLREVAVSFRRIAYFALDVRAIAGDSAIRAKFLGFTEVILYASFWALALHRMAHFLFALRIPFVPRLLSQVARFLTGIEIHPGARLGPGLFIDHGMGVVIGETAIVGANALIYHGVTLGGVDSRPCRRHPLVGDNVVIGAGAKILGPVTIGDGAKIGAASVVLANVPEGATAVGVPARIV
jgi:serine O-acetyltransferase